MTLGLSVWLSLTPQASNHCEFCMCGSRLIYFFAARCWQRMRGKWQMLMQPRAFMPFLEPTVWSNLLTGRQCETTPSWTRRTTCIICRDLGPAELSTRQRSAPALRRMEWSHLPTEAHCRREKRSAACSARNRIRNRSKKPKLLPLSPTSPCRTEMQISDVLSSNACSRADSTIEI